jgi:hypothetical protein
LSLAIDYGYNPRRRTVAWVHAAPDAQGRAAFEARGFAVPAFAWGPNELNDDAEISGAAALVFTQTRTRPTEIAAQLATYGKRLLDFDCNVLVLHLPGGAGPIANVANAHQLPIARLPANEVPEVAEEIRRWQPAPPTPLCPGSSVERDRQLRDGAPGGARAGPGRAGRGLARQGCRHYR